MPAITVKEAPASLLRQLKSRAKQHRRSLQSEVLTILEEAVSPVKRADAMEVWQRIQAAIPATPSQATAWIREDRDSR